MPNEESLIWVAIGLFFALSVLVIVKAKRAIQTPATLSEIQKKMLCRLGNDVERRMLYQHLLALINVRVDHLGTLHIARRKMEFSGLVEYDEGRVWITKKGLKVYRNLIASGKADNAD